MIIFTRHAILKLGHRGIKREMVIRTIRNPDHAESSYGDRRVVFRRLGKLYLKVVFRQEGEDIIIITQHWIKKLK